MSTTTETVRNWNSVRTVLEALILAALLWAARSLTATQTQLAVLQDNVLQLRAQLADVPGLAQRVTRLEARIDAHDETLRELREARR